MLLLPLLASSLVAGFILMYLEMRRAPEGFEDRHGFHFLWCNKRPDLADISCVWVVHSKQ